MAEMIDVLDTPEIRRHTQRVLALKDQQGKAEQAIGRIVAGIGDELIATKIALDRTPDKTAWLRWLSQHVKLGAQSAENYMRVSRLRKKFQTGFGIFSRLPLGALYVIAGLADRLVRRLVKDPRLPDPRTGQLKPIEDMDERTLKKALQLFKGRRNPKKPDAPGKDATSEALAREALASLRQAMAAMEIVNQGGGKLSSESKRAMLDEIEKARAIVLRWKAWVTPEKGRRLR